MNAGCNLCIGSNRGRSRSRMSRGNHGDDIISILDICQSRGILGGCPTGPINRKTIDAFADRDLTRDVDSEIRELLPDNGYQFISLLEYSTWADTFMHGADMIPGMIEGFEKFLSTKNTTLATVEKMIFKEKVKTDLLYSILETPDKSLQKMSNTYGEFSDGGGKKYYFYTQDMARFGLSRHREPIELNNKLGDLLLTKSTDPSHVNNFQRKIESMNKNIVCNLAIPDIKSDDTEYYKQKMSENIGYLLSTIFDSVNRISHFALKNSGLVVSYQDIKRDKEMDLNALFDGSAKMTMHEKLSPRKMGDGVMKQFEFELNNKGKSIVSGTVSFRQRS